jgi:hypothetical protein
MAMSLMAVMVKPARSASVETDELLASIVRVGVTVRLRRG